jgi:hypothetical protein
MWNIDFKTFFTILNQTNNPKIFKILLNHTSKHVRIPGQVVTTDALQRLCITHVHTKNKKINNLFNRNKYLSCTAKGILFTQQAQVRNLFNTIVIGKQHPFLP